MLKQGERIGDWIVVEVLGEGGMGAVFRCKNAMSDRIEAAVKVIKPHSLENEMERFLREVESLDSLRHRAVVRVKGWGQDRERGLLWLAMDMVSGEDLEKRLARGPLEIEEARRLFAIVADALRHAHGHGIFHRDIKPANIILAADGSPRIVDFGIAVQKGRTRLTAMGTIPGTPAYMAPEIFGGEARPDPVKLDIYALGQVLYEAVTGKHAYPEDDETDLSTGQKLVSLMGKKLKAEALDPGPDYPEELRSVVVSATQPEPSDRMKDMGAFVEGLVGGPPAKGGGFDADLPRGPATEWVQSKPVAGAAPKIAGGANPVKGGGLSDLPPTASGVNAAPPPPPPPPHSPGASTSGTSSTGGVKIAVAGAAGVGALVLALLGGAALIAAIAAGAWFYWPAPGGPERDTSVVVGPGEGGSRAVQVAVTGLATGTDYDVTIDGQTASSADAMTATFDDVPTGEVTVRVSAGPGCSVVEDGTCPGCCSCAEQSVRIEAGSGAQTVLVHVPPPPMPSPRTVRVQAPLIADGWSTFFDVGGAKGPRGKKIDSRTKDYADVVPGTYEARIEAGRCPVEAQGCWPDGDCPDGCASWKGTIDVPCGADTFVFSVDLPTPSGSPPVVTEDSSACRKTCPSGAYTGSDLVDGTRVKITGIHEDDAYCGYTGIVGVTGTVTGDLHSNDGCWMGGGLIGDDGTYYYFYKVAVKKTSGGTPATTTSAFGDGRYVKSTLPSGSSVVIIDVHPDDAYYPYVGQLTGMRCTVSSDVYATDTGWYGGSVYCPGAGTDLYFYKVALGP